MKNFVKNHNLSKLTQEKIKDMSSLVSDKQITFIIQNFPIEKTPRQCGFTDEIYHIFKEEELSVLYDFS